MNVMRYRPRFVVYCVGSNAEQLAPVVSQLERGGYQLVNYETPEQAEKDFSRRPPHMVIFCGGQAGSIFDWPQRLPETHFFQVALKDELSSVTAFAGLTDLLISPEPYSGQWLRSLDRAAERDLILYRQEQNDWDLAEWTGRLHGCSQQEILLEELAAAVKARSPNSQCVFVRCLPNRRLLVATHGHLELPDWRGRGITLKRNLQAPHESEEYQALIKELLGAPPEYIRPIHGKDQVTGIFAVSQAGHSSERMDLERIMTIAEHHSQFLELKSQVHALDQNDPQTGILHRSAFLKAIEEEIVRSRRISQPVSVLVLRLDQYSELVRRFDQVEGNLALRSLAKILKLKSRRLDRVGRISEDSLGLLLPHTPMPGALAKASRVRRMVELADFTSVLRIDSGLTVSIGASEYPSGARDADEILAAAERAVQELTAESPKRIGLAAPLDGFQPDFEAR